MEMCVIALDRLAAATVAAETAFSRDRAALATDRAATLATEMEATLATEIA